MHHTPESFAALLNGRECGKELDKTEEREAKENGLVVVFGYSDDNCELRGAINDEVGCYDGGDILINANGVVPEPDREEFEVLEKFNLIDAFKAQPKAKVEAVWGGKTPDGHECSWHYVADFPHATFDIIEDGELYCRGIVFRLSDALPK